MNIEEIVKRKEKIRELSTTLIDELKAFEEEGFFMWYQTIHYIKAEGGIK